MTRVFALFLLFVLAIAGQGCASTPKRASTSAPANPEPSDDRLAGVLRLAGSRGMAHACPIAPDKALTNAHVVVEHDSDGEARSVPLMWESLGHVGLLGAPGTTVWDRYRDLAYVTPYKATFPRWYPIAKNPPEVGDHLRFLGYDFRDKKRGFARRVFNTRVTAVFVGHVAFDPSGVRGSSGSCVLNDADEVVAINQSGQPVGAQEFEVLGVAVGVWGSLLGLEREAESR